MKRTLLTLLGVAFLAALPAAVQAQFTFTANNGAITITGYTGPGGNVTIPSATNGYPVTSIGDRAFSYCYGLTSLTIPNSVTTIGAAAFIGCSGLSAITVDSANSSYRSMAGVLFDKGQNTLIAYPAGKAGSNYSISNSVTTIGRDAFAYCSGLRSLTIPNSVTNIGAAVFIGCSGLSAITVDSANACYSSMVGVLFDKSQNTLIAYPAGKAESSYSISSSVTTIGSEAFLLCSGLTNVTIPNSVTSIGDAAFFNCSGLSTITVDLANLSYSSLAGVLFDKGQNTLIAYPAGKAGNNYSIPNGVTTIGSDSFAYCAGLTNLMIPSSVTTIGSHAFSFCSSLASLTIPTALPLLGVPHFFFAPMSEASISKEMLPASPSDLWRLAVPTVRPSITCPGPPAGARPLAVVRRDSGTRGR
jgi:hypothetical protein